MSKHLDAVRILRAARISLRVCAVLILFGCVALSILPEKLQTWLSEPGQGLSEAFKSFDTKRLAQDFEVRIRYCRYDWRLPYVTVLRAHIWAGTNWGGDSCLHHVRYCSSNCH